MQFAMPRPHSNESVPPGDDAKRLAESQRIADELRNAEAYPSCSASDSIVVHETHVSWVFLAGDYAYKVKKPIETGFLDYGTLSKRKRCCHHEVQLNRRYAPDLYLDVVAITEREGKIQMEGSGEAIEYAVKMQRFPDDALLSEALRKGKIATEEVLQLAETVASFHRAAMSSDSNQRWGDPEVVLQEAIDNFTDLRRQFHSSPPESGQLEQLERLELWTRQAYERLEERLRERHDQGFIRECHGDLHLNNVVRWRGKWTPFDGIEFNEEFRWIDILSDAAFLAMDFAAQGHLDLGRSFVSAYLEQTGDYRAMPLMRWYLVYRAMVRGKVAAIRAGQSNQTAEAREVERHDCLEHIGLAEQLSQRGTPRLWITYGVSGSGKTTGTECLIQQHGAVRLRSDVERKRLFGLRPSQRPGDEVQQRQLYSPSATQRTYERLAELATMLLRNGEPVVVDATFLKRQFRNMFQAVAGQENVPFRIVPFAADIAELERRVVERSRQRSDASDATLEVLHQQLDSLEPLTRDERQFVETLSAQSDER